MTSSMIRKLNGLLKTESLGKVIRYQDEMESTNSTLLDLGEKGASEGTVVIADRQTRGRGRLEHSWISPADKNLYISILFRPEIVASDAPLFTLIASVALVAVIQRLGLEDVNIKWPNDIRISGKKVSGVLTEMRPRREMADFIVVGIGVNINMSRDDIDSDMGDVARLATSIRENLGKDLDRAKFAADLLLELEKWYKVFTNRGRGKNTIISEWVSKWGDINKRIRVNINDQEEFEGKAIGIDDSGFLIVELDSGEETKVIAGDVRTI